jgi:hypothetical protein
LDQQSITFFLAQQYQKTLHVDKKEEKKNNRFWCTKILHKVGISTNRILLVIFFYILSGCNDGTRKYIRNLRDIIERQRETQKDSRNKIMTKKARKITIQNFVSRCHFLSRLSFCLKFHLYFLAPSLQQKFEFFFYKTTTAIFVVKNVKIWWRFESCMRPSSRLCILNL